MKLKDAKNTHTQHIVKLMSLTQDVDDDRESNFEVP